MTRWIMVLAACVALGGAVQAQAPGGVYNEPDGAALAWTSPPGGKAPFRRHLKRLLAENPGHPIVLAQLAHDAYARGNSDDGEHGYAQALEGVKPGSEAHRRVLWSRGWSRFRAERYDAALADWHVAAQLHGGHPFWLPYTLVMGYGAQGDLDAGVAWYDALVAAEPAWATPEGFETRVARWDAGRQQPMRRVFKAWRARPVGASTD